MSSSIMSSQGMVLATAMAAVSAGTVLLFAFRLQQKSTSTSIVSSDQGKKKEQNKKKKKKVHFAEGVVDPTGNSDEYRKMHSSNCGHANNNSHSFKYSIKKGGKVEEMPANRVALYNGILRDRVLHRVAYSC